MKYKFTGEVKTLPNGVIVKRIQRISDGFLGGWLESEKNLSQEGDAWVHRNAHVYGDARVSGNAQVYENARIYGNARVSGNAWIYENARVYGNVHVYENAWVCGNARVYGDAWIFGGARICGDAHVYGDAPVYGDAYISGDARVSNRTSYINILMHPYPVTITPQNIIIGCEIRSRFGKNQWTSKDPSATPELIKIYKPLINTLHKQLPRRK